MGKTREGKERKKEGKEQGKAKNGKENKGQKAVAINNAQKYYTKYDLTIIYMLHKGFVSGFVYGILICTDYISKLHIKEPHYSYLFCVFSDLTVLCAAIDMPTGIINVGKVAWALLSL